MIEWKACFICGAIYDYAVFLLISMDPNPTVRHTFWTVVVGNYLNWLATCSVNQAMVQRCLAMPNLRKSNMYVLIIAFADI